MLFRLKSATFARGRTIYAKGDLIQSDSDLDAKYPNKFDKVESGRPSDGTQLPKIRKDPKPEAPIAPPAPVKGQEVEVKKEEEVVETKKNVPTFGEDVTDHFAGAKAASLCVFKDEDKGYTVTTKEDVTKALKSGLKKKSAVDAFVEEYLQDDDASK